MTTEAFHPDHLKPGDMVGPWRIVEPLGTGNFGRAFKAERDGEFFTLKMAIRPVPEHAEDVSEEAQDQRQVDGRMRHEAATLLVNTRLPGLPNIRAVDKWPHSTRGYTFFVTDYVEGAPFHDWRERTRPNAAQLVDIFLEVVRAVGRLHRRGILIRDFKSEHIIVGADDKPTMVDLGSAWLPGASTLTVGLAPGTPHLLPPECVAFLREGTWKQGARFEPGEEADLYQLGVFMYEALTDCWPFDPRMTPDEQLTAIQTIIPRAPHRMNPEVPEPLSRIVMKLLEKLPEDRYPSTEALHQALWEAAKERTQKAWKVRLVRAPQGPAPMTQDEVEERRLHQQAAELRAKEARKRKAEALTPAQALERLSAAIQQAATEQDAEEEKAARRKKRFRRIALGVGLLLVGLAFWAAWWEWRSAEDSIAYTAAEKGIPLMSPLRHSRPARAVAAWLCATFSVGCTAPQVRPPLPGRCPKEAVQSMKQLNFLDAEPFNVIIDINQPGPRDQIGIYRPGPITSRVQNHPFESPVPEGTLLYGQLYTEGITQEDDVVAGRYTEALLPDGRRVPVCFVLGGISHVVPKEPGSKPGEVRLRLVTRVVAVNYWP